MCGSQETIIIILQIAKFCPYNTGYILSLTMCVHITIIELVLSSLPLTTNALGMQKKGTNQCKSVA